MKQSSATVLADLKTKFTDLILDYSYSILSGTYIIISCTNSSSVELTSPAVLTLSSDVTLISGTNLSCTNIIISFFFLSLSLSLSLSPSLALSLPLSPPLSLSLSPSLS